MKLFTKKLMVCTCLATLMIGVVGCGDRPKETSIQSSPDNSTKQENTKEKITLSFFTHLPDRSTGLGKLEQLILDQYLEENPHVDLKIEALEGEAYRQKITAYLASNELPDVFHVWGQPSFLSPITENGYVAELNMSDYEDYNFVPGSLDGFMHDGKLYGLPKIMDFMVMYYNKDLFKQNNVELPNSFEDIFETAQSFRDNNISPISMDGKDAWPLGVIFQEILLKQSGDQKLIYNILDGKLKASDSPEFLQAAEMLQEMTTKKLFQDSYLSADYGASLNVFGQEKAAMYYMGSWEVGLSESEAYSESFRKNVGVMPVPAFENGVGDNSNLLAWYGGGYSVSQSCKEKEEAIRLLNYIMKPENWAKNGWQLGICMPAQDFSEFVTGKETEMQKEVVKIISNAKDTSGTVWIDHLTPAFKTDSMNLTQELSAGLITPADYVSKIDKLLEDIK